MDILMTFGLVCIVLSFTFALIALTITRMAYWWDWKRNDKRDGNETHDK